ncbi:MAG: sugar ABC transporter permease [Chloroflexi bacterium]|nr:sugar ABC transporter permease [Chloroflexota bacterium]
MGSVAAAAVRPRRSAARRREAIAGILWSSPWLVGFFLFTFGPMIASLYLAFTDYTISNLSPKIVGFDNFARALSGQDHLFWPSLVRTLQFAAVMVPLGVGGALAAAVLLNQGIRLVALFRTLFFLPSLTPVVASAVIWAWLFNPNWGLLNHLLAGIGIKGPKWLSDPDTAMASLIIVALWGAIGGSTMVVFLAGLQGVPKEMLEAAEIDGAGAMRRFWTITIPMISPTLLFNLVLGIIGALKVFASPVVMTAGGPSYATWTFILHLYQNGFQFFDMGYASALAWVFMVIVVSLTLLNLRVSRSWVYYEGEARDDAR